MMQGSSQSMDFEGGKAILQIFVETSLFDDFSKILIFFIFIFVSTCEIFQESEKHLRSRNQDENSKRQENSSSFPGSGRDAFTNFITINYSQPVLPEKNVKTRFDDVLGIDEFKDELLEIC